MKSTVVVLGLVADRLDLLICRRGRAIGGVRIPAAFGADAAQWSKSLRGAARALEAAAATLGVSRAAVHVLYRSPSECVEYSNLSLDSTAEAQEAAILGCADALSCPLDSAVAAAAIIGRDSIGLKKQTHLVVAADHDDALAAIVDTLEDAGLKFVTAAPLDAIIMAKVAADELRTHRKRAYLYLGEQRSFLTVTSQGSLTFARPIALGYDALARGLARPVRQGTEQESLSFSLESARRFLFQYGFPNPAHSEPLRVGDQQVRAGQVLPLLQPVLQRLIVELRQSLRFAVPDAERAELELCIGGPGSAMPQTAEIIAHELGVTTATDKRYAEFAVDKCTTPGSELLDAIGDRSAVKQLGLAPQRLQRRRQSGGLRRCLWLGAAAAIAVIAFEAWRYTTLIAQARQTSDQLADRAKSLQDSAPALAAVASMNTLEAEIQKHTSNAVDFRSCLHELSRITPQTIRLVSVSLNEREGKMIGMINGVAFEDPNAPGHTDLETFIDALRGSALFTNVSLANIQSSLWQDRAGQRFEASFEVVAVPRIAGAPPALMGGAAP